MHNPLSNLSDTGLNQDSSWDSSNIVFIASDLLDPSWASASAIAGTAVKAAQATALYLTEAGDSSAISVNDIHQGQIGDCFALSPIGELALLNPAFIQGMIKANTNGTETVTLYNAANGHAPGVAATGLKAVTEVVTNSFAPNGVNSGATQDVANGVKEIWVQVLEKAFAELNGGVSGTGAYTGIQNGGSPVIAMEQLTGRAATYISPASLTLAQLQADVTARDLIVMDTFASKTQPFGLVGSHAYMFEGIVGSGASAAVKLGNPWGIDQPALIPFASLSKGIAEIDIGHFT